MEIAAPAPVATRKSAGNAFLERLLMVNRAPPLPTARQDRAEMATAAAPKGKVQAAPAATPTATVGLAPLAMKSEIMSAFLPCRLDGQRWDLELCSRLTLRLSPMLLVVRSRLVMLALFKKTMAPTDRSTSSLKEGLGGMTRVQSRSPRLTRQRPKRQKQEPQGQKLQSPKRQLPQRQRPPCTATRVHHGAQARAREPCTTTMPAIQHATAMIADSTRVHARAAWLPICNAREPWQ